MIYVITRRPKLQHLLNYLSFNMFNIKILFKKKRGFFLFIFLKGGEGEGGIVHHVHTEFKYCILYTHPE